MKKVLAVLTLLALLVQAHAQEAPASADSALLDAVCLIENGNVPAAAAMLDSLSAAAPKNDAVHYYRGICRYSGGDYKGATEALARAVALDPSNSWYKETLANLYIGIGDAASASKLYRELKEVNPAKFQDLYTLPAVAQAFRLKRDYPAFFSTLSDLVRSTEIDDEMKYNALMGSLGGFDSRTFNAIIPQMDALMQAYVDAEPLSLHAHSLHMETAARLNHHQTVIDECYTMMRLAPDDPEQQLTSLSIIGDTYHQTGRNAKAFRTYEKALKIDPEYCTVLNNYAYFLSLQKRRLSKAERMSRITVEKEPDNATYLDTYGWILYLRGKAKEAKPVFKHAMIYGGRDSAVILEHFALVLDKLGETDLAEYYHKLAENKKQQ